MIEVQLHTVSTRGDGYDAVDPFVRRRIGDDEEARVVVHQLVGGRESLAYSSLNRSNELLMRRFKPVVEGLELGLRRRLAAIDCHCRARTT